MRLAALAFVSVLLIAPTAADFDVRAGKVDKTNDTSAADWIDAVLAEVEPNSMIVSWWSYSTPLWYAQLIEGRGTGIFVADDRTRLDRNLGDLNTVIDDNLDNRPVYVIRIDESELAALRDRYNLTPLADPRARNVLRVTPRQSDAGDRLATTGAGR